MACKKKNLFSSPGPLSTSSNNTLNLSIDNINNSKKSTKSSTKHCNSKKFRILRSILRHVLFSLPNLSQGNFLYCRKLFILTKSLNTALAPNRVKPVALKTCCTCCSFCQVLKHRDEYSFFLSHVK